MQLSTGIDVNIDDTWENLSYPQYELNEPSRKLPVDIFESPPAFGKRPTSFAIEIHDPTHVSIVITQVYPYRERFDAMGVPGGRVGVTETSKGDYVRIMKHVDVSNEGEVARIVEVVEKVMKNVALRCLLDGQPEPESAVSKVLDSWRQRPNMHFAAAKADL